jgi:predicted transcriptional regulator
MSEVYDAQAGGLQVLHTITTRPHAPTAAEVAKDLDADKRMVQEVLTKLYRAGYVTRAKREQGGFGPNPYEYSVYTPENNE